MIKFILLTLIPLTALAQQLTFNVSAVKATDASVQSTLSWTTQPLATSCNAWGAWSGAKSPVGSETRSLTSSNKTYNFRCNWGATSEGSAELSWTPPTENVDGTPLTDLAGYRFLWGQDQQTLSNSAEVANPGLTRYVVENLSSALWWFCVKVFNSAGTESVCSALASKDVTEGGAMRAIGLRVIPNPSLPSGATGKRRVRVVVIPNPAIP